MPSLVEVVSATSSAGAPSTRAYSSRSRSCCSIRASKCPFTRPCAVCSSSASRAAARAAAGTGPSVPAFR